MQTVSFNTQHEICNLFRVIIHGTKRIQKCLNYLKGLLNPGQLESLFDMLCDQDVELITWENICEFMRLHQFQLHREEALDLLHRTCGSKEGISKQNFLLFFEIGEFNQPYPFTLEIELSLLKYFEEDISLERIADVERKSINNRWDYSFDGAFKSIAGSDQTIDQNKMSKFFTRLKVPHSQGEIKLLYQRVGALNNSITKDMLALLLLTQKERASNKMDQWANVLKIKRSCETPLFNNQAKKVIPKYHYFQRLRSKYSKEIIIPQLETNNPQAKTITPYEMTTPQAKTSPFKKKPFLSGSSPYAKKPSLLQNQLKQILHQKTELKEPSSQKNQTIRKNQSMNLQKSITQYSISNETTPIKDPPGIKQNHQRTNSTNTLKKAPDYSLESLSSTQQKPYLSVVVKQQRYEDFLQILRQQALYRQKNGDENNQSTPFELLSDRIQSKLVFHSTLEPKIPKVLSYRCHDESMEMDIIKEVKVSTFSPQRQTINSQRQVQAISPQRQILTTITDQTITITDQSFSNHKHIQIIFPLLSTYISQMRCLKNVLSQLPQEQVLHLKSLKPTDTWESEWALQKIETNEIKQMQMKNCLDFYSFSVLEPIKQTTIGELGYSEILVASQLFQMLHDQQTQIKQAKDKFFQSKTCSLIQLYEYLIKEDGPSLKYQAIKDLLDQACYQQVCQEEVNLMIQKFNNFTGQNEITFQTFLSELTP